MYYSTETKRGDGFRIEPVHINSTTYKYYLQAIEHFGKDNRINVHRKWYKIVGAEKSKEVKGVIDFHLKLIK